VVVFSAYLRGIETSFRNTKPHSDFSVFSVPTRNWNRLPCATPQFSSSPFSAYLRGIETTSTWKREKAKISVFSVPTRNWSPVNRKTREWCTLFSAYLRGIETTVTDPKGRTWKRFQRTYEELKRKVYCFYIFSTVHRFQRTYEELKLWLFNIGHNTIFGFQRTYEELKQWHEEEHPRKDNVFSVPTRNWNLESGASPQEARSVFSVPTRNWNVVSEPTMLSSSLRFQRTYEELKPVQKVVSDIPGETFSAYLRGIETRSAYRCRGYEPSVFSVPTRNWNRVPDRWFDDRSGRFQRTYEELKRVNSCVERPGTTVFSVPTRNWNPNHSHR